MGTLLIPLGTNGYIPTLGRHTMSFLVLTAGEAILLDAGTGVSRLLDSKIQDIDKSKRAHVKGVRCLLHELWLTDEAKDYLYLHHYEAVSKLPGFHENRQLIWKAGKFYGKELDELINRHVFGEFTFLSTARATPAVFEETSYTGPVSHPQHPAAEPTPEITGTTP